MSEQAISSHALLSDSRSAALVDSSGSIEWWCAPVFDSPSVFGRILDPEAGHFSITAQDLIGTDRSYLDNSLVLRTSMATPTGTAELTDALAVGEQERGHALGLKSPCVMLRLLTCTKGTVRVHIEFSPRFEYGLTTPLMFVVDGEVIARGSPTTMKLSTGAPMTVDGSVAHAQLEMSEGDSIGFALEVGSSWESLPGDWSQDMIESRIEDTRRAWESWGEDHQFYDGPYADLVTESGRILQGLTYRPTGAIVAAPTTSLPETIGGGRNWDYRYCWIRDASFTLRALWVAACPDEAGVYLDYLTAAASSVYVRGQLQIMFGIDGRRDLSERTLPWLRGWRDSAPVRVGNGAWAQAQHDVYGELLSSVHRLGEQMGDFDDFEKRFLKFLAHTAASVWKEPDNGIWEIRGEPRHYLHSKLMCWVALDRAISMAESLDAADEADEWGRARSEIRQMIEEQGFSDEAGAFTQVVGERALDASALVIPMVGFLPFDDKRVLSTIEAVQSELTDESGLVFRYLADDGLEGEEGAFLFCTFWLAEALAGAGRVDEARDVFERAASYRNDVGLLAEQVDPHSGEMIGNYPQAFSHIGLINAAWAIKQAEETS